MKAHKVLVAGTLGSSEESTGCWSICEYALQPRSSCRYLYAGAKIAGLRVDLGFRDSSE